MRRRLTGFVLVVLVALSLAGGRAFAQTALDELLAQAAAMSAAGEHAQAYALLSAHEDTHIGELRFDYALGRAALYAGRPDRATIAFARVVALDPAHAGARIDMGRAYLALGNRAQARAAFESLLALDPPPGLRDQLLVYLAEAKGEGERRLALRGHLSVFGGASSNVNQAPGQGQIFVPALLTVLQLSDQNVAKDDTFLGVGGGIEAARPLDARYSLIAAAEFLARENTHESAFDVGGLWGSVGLARTGDRHIARAQFQFVNSTLGGDTSRRVEALSVDFSETQTQAGSLGGLFGFANVGRTRHPQADLEIFDADFVNVGAGVNARIGERSSGSVAFLVGGDNDRGGNPSGDRRGIGIRFAGETVLTRSLRLLGTVGAWNSRYDGFDSAFLVQREDRRLDLEVTVRYELFPKLDLRLGILRSVQDSNIPIYEYKRTDWWLGLRREFG